MKIIFFSVLVVIAIIASLSEVVISSKVAIFGAQNVNRVRIYRALVLGIAENGGEVENDYYISLQCGATTVKDESLKVNSKTRKILQFQVKFLKFLYKQHVEIEIF